MTENDLFAKIKNSWFGDFSDTHPKQQKYVAQVMLTQYIDLNLVAII